jgi:endonuclease YncB( thermonuclease family)
MTRSSRAPTVAARHALQVCKALPLVMAGFCAVASAAGAPPSPDACPVHGSEHDKVVSVNDRLELTLEDGRTLRLAGFEPVHPTPENPDFAGAARDRLARLLTNAIDVLPLAKPDRWGRVPAFAFVLGATPEALGRSLAVWLLAQGDGRFMPDPDAAACQIDFLQAEAAARDRAAGLWHDPYYAVISPTDRAAFAEKAATNAIVEGNVVDVDARPRRIYLLFGARHSGAFAVTILQRDAKMFDQAGLNPQRLIGRRIRVRGLLDLRFGAEISVSEPAAIEIVSMPETRSSVVQHVEAKAADTSAKPH